MEGLTVIALLGAAVSTAGGAWTAYLGYRTQRDKLAHDSELISLKSEAGDCAEARERDRLRMDEMQREINELRRRLDAYLMPPVTHLPAPSVSSDTAQVAALKADAAAHRAT